MSIELYDAALRLRAARERRPLPRTVYAPILPPTSAVALYLDPDGTAHLATATGHQVSADPEHTLAALAGCGVGLTQTHRTLVVAHRRDLDHLDRLARSGVHGPHRDVAAVADWWVQRADHPGSGATYVLTEAAKTRYAIGTAPDADDNLSTWLAWLDIHDNPPHALLAAADRIASGTTLPGLLDLARSDTASWNWHRKRCTSGRDWRNADSRTEAALGLATRSDHAEAYASLLLDDPLVAARAVYTGEVLTGTVTAAPERGVYVITASHPLTRFRQDQNVTGWLGPPSLDVKNRKHPVRSAVVTTTSIDAHGDLHVTIGETVCTGARVGQHALDVGATVTLRPTRPDLFMQQRARTALRRRYTHDGNWLAGRGLPKPKRRDVPLDIVVAAAED